MKHFAYCLMCLKNMIQTNLKKVNQNINEIAGKIDIEKMKCPDPYCGAQYKYSYLKNIDDDDFDLFVERE